MQINKVCDLRIWHRNKLQMRTIDKIIVTLCNHRGLFPHFYSRDGEANLIYRIEARDSWTDEDIQTIENEIQKKVDDLILLKENLELIKDG